MKKIVSVISILALIISLVSLGIVYKDQEEEKPLGSVVGNEYTATTTLHYGLRDDQLIKEGWGSLGSITITTAGDLAFQLLDATSTVVTGNATGRAATSSLIIADIPASLVAGTYTFDVIFNDGLYFDIVDDTDKSLAVTSTITFR